jgi:hypothetical protein
MLSVVRSPRDIRLPPNSLLRLRNYSNSLDLNDFRAVIKTSMFSVTSATCDIHPKHQKPQLGHLAAPAHPYDHRQEGESGRTSETLRGWGTWGQVERIPDRPMGLARLARAIVVELEQSSLDSTEGRPPSSSGERVV